MCQAEYATTAADPDAEDGLVARARSDLDAFGRLYDLHYPRVLRHCLRRLFLCGVAEDVTSEVFLRVAARMPGFDGRTHDDFSRWLYAVATNEINAYLRKSRRRARLLEEAVRRKAVPTAPAAGATGPHPDWPRVYEAILALTPRDQSVVSLWFYENLSHEQIGGVLGLRPVAVRVALSRAVA